MRRQTMIVVLLLAIMCLAISPSASAQSRKRAFSGCEKGTHLGKVAITVEEDGDTCHVTDVTPASVCVAPNGAIRWEVYGNCDVSGSEQDPALAVTPPDPLLAFFDPDDRPPTILEDCRIASVSSTKKNVFFCDVNENAVDGFYKYGLTGQITGVDPGIEVRGPRAP